MKFLDPVAVEALRMMDSESRKRLAECIRLDLSGMGCIWVCSTKNHCTKT